MSNFLTGLNQLDPSVKRHNGGGSSFTLDEIGTTQATRLVVGGVEQVPNVDFTVSGTTLSTTSATPSGTNNVVTFQYFKSGTVNTATVASSVAANGVNNTAMADDAIGIAELSATGTASSSTFLRGDNAWAAVTSPALSFVSTQVASDSSSIEFTGIDNTSDTWMIQFEGVRMATESYYMQIHTSNDTSSHSYDTGASDYNWAVTGAYYSSCYCKYDDADDSILMGFDPFAGGSDATNGMSARIHIHAPSNTDFHTLITWEWALNQTSATTLVQRTFGVGKRAAAEAVTAVKFSMVSGNLAEGRFSLYKLAHS